MNEAVMFDSLQAFKNFQEAGVAEKHAEVFVEEMNKIVVSRIANLATKAELQSGLSELETRLTVRIGTMLAIAVAVIGLMMKLLA